MQVVRTWRRGILELPVLRQWRLLVGVLEAWLGGSGWSEVPGCIAKVFPAKAQHFDASGGDACDCRNPLGGTVVVTSPVSGLQVKTLDHLDLDDGGVMRRHPLGCVVVELRYLASLFYYHRKQVWILS